MTTDPTTDPTRPGPPDTDVLPIFAASAAAAGWPSAPNEVPNDVGEIDEPRHGPERTRLRALVAVSVLLVLTLGLTGYLWATTRAYEARASWSQSQARTIGVALATARTELSGTTAELEAVRTQLDTAQSRITTLADEKAQVGDDREAQRLLVDYQQRISVAAGKVASALERCVQGQDTLIGYLNNPTAYDPTQLAQFGTQVNGLCQSATDANKSLQDELSK